MSSAVKKVEEYPPIRTTKDGRQYVRIGDVLNSSAGRAEIRRQAETQIPKPTNGNVKSNGSMREENR